MHMRTQCESVTNGIYSLYFYGLNESGGRDNDKKRDVQVELQRSLDLAS